MRRVMVISILLIPVFLWGWANDIKVSTLTEGIPTSYDITVPSDTIMFVAYTYNRNDTAFISMYRSTDDGITWSKVWGGYGVGETILNVDLEFYEDTIYSLILSGGNIYLIKLLNNGTWLETQTIGYPDSAASAFLEIATFKDTTVLYVAATEVGTYDTLIVYRSLDFGVTWERAFWAYIPDTTTHRTIYDFDVTYRSDTAFLYLTYIRKDSIGRQDIYTMICQDTLGTLLNYFTTSSIETDTLISSLYPSLSAFGNYVVCFYEGENDIKYSFSSDYGGTFTKNLDFPYNTADSVEAAPFVKWWWLFFSGFNMIFLRGANLYYVEIGIDTAADTLEWSEPVLVSDEVPVYYYPFNFTAVMEFYRPKLANHFGLFNPAVVWHCDYSSYIPYPTPVWLYDSTQFLVDSYYSVGIREESKRDALTIKVKSPANDVLKVEFTSPASTEISISIYDILGRRIKVLNNIHLVQGTGTVNIDITSLKRGIYFLKVTGKGINTGARFIKVR